MEWLLLAPELLSVRHALYRGVLAELLAELPAELLLQDPGLDRRREDPNLFLGEELLAMLSAELLAELLRAPAVGRAAAGP